MPLPTIPDATKVTVHGTLFGETVENVYAVNTPPTPSEADLSTICAAFQVAYEDIMAPLSDQYSIDRVEAVYLGSAPQPQFTLLITPPQTGGAAAPSSPGSVCLCVSLRSGFTGRRSRGRKYFSGIPEAATADNLIDATLCDAVVAGINDQLIPTLVSNGTPLGVVSFVGAFFTVITLAICVDNYVDSQRRRLHGRGR